MCVYMCFRVIQSESSPRTGNKRFLWYLSWLQWQSRIAADHIRFVIPSLNYAMASSFGLSRVIECRVLEIIFIISVAIIADGVVSWIITQATLAGWYIRTPLASSKSISVRRPTHDRIAYVQVWKWAILPLCTMNRRNPLCPDLILAVKTFNRQDRPSLIVHRTNSCISRHHLVETVTAP